MPEWKSLFEKSGFIFFYFFHYLGFKQDKHSNDHADRYKSPVPNKNQRYFNPYHYYGALYYKPRPINDFHDKEIDNKK